MSPGGAAASTNLADLVVQFISKGQEELKKSLEDVQTALGAVVLAVQKFNTQAVAALEANKQKTKEAAEQTSKLADSFQKAGTAIHVALGAGIGLIGNFVRQGVGASGVGQMFGYTMERLSLTIAGLFRPELERVLEGIQRLTNWIGSLSDTQKKNIAHWIEAGAAALAVGVILPRIVAGIRAVIVAVQALSAAIAGAEATTGIGAILPVIGLLIEGMTGLVVGTEGGRAALSELWDMLKEVVGAAKELGDALELGDVWQDIQDGVQTVTRAFVELIKVTAQWIQMLQVLSGGMLGALLRALMPITIVGQLGRQLGVVHHEKEAPGSRNALPPKVGGFEDLNATYRRIAVAAMRASSGARSPEERTAENTERAAVALDAIRAGLNGIHAQPFAP